MENNLSGYQLFIQTLIPILVVVLLIILIVLFIKLVYLITRLIVFVDKADDTVVSLNKSIEKLQSPLDVGVKISNTIEKTHDGIINTIDRTKNDLVDSIDQLKEKLQVLKNQRKGSE